MPDVIAQVTLKAGGVYYPPGSLVTIEDEAEVKDLLSRDPSPIALAGEQSEEEAEDEIGAGGSEGDGEAEAEGGAEHEEKGGPKPFFDGFPHAEILKDNGIETLDAVPRSMKELQALEGIGAGRAADILKALGA